MEDVGKFYGHLVYIFYGHLGCFGIFYGDLVYFVAIWSILWSFRMFWYILWWFGIFCGHLVCCNKENMATLV
jgi:hypothetical protein